MNRDERVDLHARYVANVLGSCSCKLGPKIDFKRHDEMCRFRVMREMYDHFIALEDALQTLAWQHGWGVMGKCICEAHNKVTELGLQYETPALREEDA